MVKDNFKLYSAYYDLIYQDKDYELEANYIHDLICRFAPDKQHVLELGSGTGKHASLFAEMGYQVFGVERSEEMLAIALTRKQLDTEFIHEDISDFKVNRRFDIALSLFHVVSYLTDTTQLIKTFRNINQHLNDDGIFIFDVWHTPAVYLQVPERRSKKWANQQIEVMRNATPFVEYGTNTVQVRYDIEVTNKDTGEKINMQEDHFMRHYSQPELEILAFATGFNIIHSEAFLSRELPSSETWGVCYIFKKQKNV